MVRVLELLAGEIDPVGISVEWVEEEQEDEGDKDDGEKEEAGSQGLLGVALMLRRSRYEEDDGD